MFSAEVRAATQLNVKKNTNKKRAPNFLPPKFDSIQQMWYILYEGRYFNRSQMIQTWSSSFSSSLLFFVVLCCMYYNICKGRLSVSAH